MSYFVKRNTKVTMDRDGSIELLERLEAVMADGTIIAIPTGFVCDGASTPRLLWHVTGGPRYSHNLRPGIVHDYCYRNGVLPRKAADKLFRDLLRNEGKSWAGALIMYWAVRVFGGKFYKPQ